MVTKRVKLSEASKRKGKTQESVNNMSEEEIIRRANSDPDNPILTEEQLKEFKIAQKNGDPNGKES